MKQIKFLITLVTLLTGSVCSYADTFTVLSAEGKAIEYTTEYSSTVIVAENSATNQAIEGALTIPDAVEYNGNQYTVTKIGKEAFKDNKKLTSVTIGDNITNINESAFYGCTNLASASFGMSLARVDKYAFLNCSSLTSVAFPDGFKSVGQSAFASSGLSGDLVLPSSVLTLEEQAFAWTNITSVRLLSNATIKAGAFNNCNNITAYYFSPTCLQPTMYYNSSYGSTMTINYNTRIYVSQATLSMLENNWFQSGHTLQNNYNSVPSYFIAYDSTEGGILMNQINMADEEGTSVGSLALCFTVTSTDEANPTAALYCPPSTGYVAADILKSGANAVIKNNLTANGKLIIPETVTDRAGNTYTVTVIGAEAFGEYASNYYGKITGLKIPSTITHIGVQAFRYLQYLSGNLIIPASVCQIGHPDVAQADVFYSEYYGTHKVDGVYMMHTAANQIDWYETKANNYFAYSGNNETSTYLYVCQEIYDKAYGKNGATRYPYTSAFYSWLISKYWNGGSHIALFNPATLGLKWDTEQTIVDISGEYEAPELENPFGLPVTYSSSHPSVADIDAETGEITLGTAEGSTTLNATFAGNEEYTTEVSVQTVITRRGEPMLAEDQENHNEFNTCEALTKVTRWTPNPELYMENNMWEMPHMMDGKFYVSAFWQSNNYYDWCEWFSYDNEKFLQLTCSPAYLSPNYGWYYDDDGTNGFSHDQQPGSTLGGFICFKVKGSGTIIVRGFTVSDNAKMGICVQGNVAKLFSGGNEDTEITYNYTLENADDEAYAYVYGVSLLPGSRQGYIKYIKFIPDGTVMADVSVGGVAIEEESDDVLGDGGSVGFEWREDEDGGGEDPEADVKRFVGLDDIEGDGEEGDEPASSTRYPVLILNNANLTSENGPAIEVNSHDRFLIELRGQNTIKSLNGNAAISMGTLQSEDWGGGTISIVGLEEGASLTIPAVENVENGIYLAESSIKVENFSGDLSGTNCGIRFQGYDSSDWENDANCNMRFGKGMSLKMRGGEEALTGFNPQSMHDPGYYDEEEDQWVYYALLGADLDDPRVIWSDKGGVYGEEEEVYVEDPENPEEGEWYYPITPAKYLYFGVRPTEETITISTAGMATFSSRFSLDFSEIEGMKAYVVSEFEPETKTLVMESVDEVPAQTGLLLKGTPGTYTVPVIDEAEYTCNLLVPITRDIILQPTETIDDEEYTNFVLTRYNGNVGFYRFDTPQSYSAGKAYLQIETSLVEKANDGSSEVTAFNMIFDDDATGMESLINLNNHQNNKIYNLSGQRLQKLQKGINIVNGEKMFVY